MLSLLILLSFSDTALFSQKDTVINKYAKVLSRSDYQITVDDASVFNDGDYVLIIQMKGVSINAENNSGYGLLLDKVGKPGEYEFLIINSVIGNTITFLNKIKKYDPAGFVQIVKVPFFNSASFNDTLTCKTWNPTDGTGGVLAIIVGRTLTLNGNIDVSGKGFRGGKDTVGLGLCADADGIKDVYSFPASFQNAGYKGEGISSHFSPFLGANPEPLPLLLKGQGQLFSGGGGGNGRFSGGGGGSNRGIGFNGGVEDITCGIVFPYLPISGGNGGFSVTLEIDTISKTGGVFMGGGGGSSTSLEGSFATSGGNGGGIIFIIADTIKGNNKSIIASGDSAKTATNIFSGAGGGGAGGSIMIFSQSYSSDSLKIKINGAKGGDVYHLWATDEGGGPGGGGGGGYIALLKPISTKISIDSTGGGVSLIKYSGFDPDIQNNGGGIGKMRTGVVPVLTGFLFNSISSNITGNQVDSICSNVPFGLITGTSPVGGVAPYDFLWQRSTTSESAGYDTVPGIYNGQTYSPGLLTQTTWFRRVVTDNSAPVISDTSKPVNIIVQPAITGNLVGKDTTICYNQNPLSLIPLNAGPSNGSSYNYYEYKWIENNTNTNWNTSPDAAGTNNLPSGSYDPPALTNTTYFQRIVTSGRCVNYSLTVTITVLPLITGNITARPDSVICEGSLFNNLGASAPGGGDLINYWYQWQDSVVSSVWNPASGTNTGTTYTPDTSTFSVIEKRFLRRVVFSGPDSVCQSRSLPILLTRYHKITNNTISANQTIGYDSIPDPLSGLPPAGGAGTGLYSYLWQSKKKITLWNTADPIFNGLDYSPAALPDTTWYRRIIYSPTINVCKDTSNIIVVNVHSKIIGNTISLASGAPEDTICYGLAPDLLKGAPPSGGIPGDYGYKWYSSMTGGDPWKEIADSIRPDFKPDTLKKTRYFRRYVSSPATSPTSTDKSNFIKITVLPLISNSIASSDTICYGTQPSVLQNVILSGGDNIYKFIWLDSTDDPITGATSDTYQPPNLFLPAKYRRIVYSGSNDCCIDTSNTVSIGINQLPTGTITSTTPITICDSSRVLLDISLTGASPWKVIYNENSTQVTVNNVTGPNQTLFASPVTGTALTTFNYSLASVVDNNNCTATSLTGSRKADVYKMPVAVAGPDAVVCGPKVTLIATLSIGTDIGKWYYPAAVVDTTLINPTTVNVTIDSIFAGKNISHEFIWKEINAQCSDKDTVLITFDKRVSTINAGPDTAIYSFDNIYHMLADPLQPWETGAWTVFSGTGDFYKNPEDSTEVRNLSKGITNIFKWKVTNGTCNREALVRITVYSDSIPQGFSPNDDLWNNTFIIKGLDTLNQIAELKVVNGAGTEVFSASNRTGQTWTDWDGKNSKGFDLPEGTYYYLLKITSKGNGQVFKRSGFIVLKRY